MFSLSEAGKYNLEAIAEAFHRASLWHGPLYHERLVPWGGIGPATVSEDEWERFIEFESDKLPDDEWWEWEGPASRSPGWDASFLGRWFGDPEARNSFFNLVESTLTVLAEEDLKELEIRNVLQFDFRSGDGWVGTLHSWAFRYQMPLLRSDMTVWGREDEGRSEFFDTVNLWRQLDGRKRYPAHPIRWSLIDDVFTSSIAAIRALLCPGLVITTNEPWPLVDFERESQQLHENGAAEAEDISASESPKDIDVVPNERDGDATEDSVKDQSEAVSSRADQETNHLQVRGEDKISRHRIIHGPYGYAVLFSGYEEPVVTTKQTGLIRIAKLIETDGKTWEPDELAIHGERKSRKYGRAATPINNLEDVQRLGKHRAGIAGRSEKYDPAAIKKRKELRQALREWKAVQDEALARNCQIEAEEADDQMAKIRPILNLSMESDQYRKAKGTVARTIRDTITDLQTLKPSMAGELELLWRQIDLTSPEVRFVSLPHLTKWVVERPL